MQLHEQLHVELSPTFRIERDLTAEERRKRRSLDVFISSGAGRYLSKYRERYNQWDPLAHIEKEWINNGSIYLRTIRWRESDEVLRDNKTGAANLYSRGVRVIAVEDGQISVEFIRGFKFVNLWTSVELDRKLRGFDPRPYETLEEKIDYAAESEFSVAGYERPWKEPVRPQLFRIFDRITS